MTRFNWTLKNGPPDFGPVLRRYQRYLEDSGLRPSTINNYMIRVKIFLKFAGDDQPSAEVFDEFRDHLLDKKLSRSSINNYSFSVQKFYKMIGEDISFTFLKPNNQIPYYFDEDDVLAIFSAVRNIKHLAMLQTMFFACLRAFELCNLDDMDLDLKARTIRVREGKGGQDGVAYISDGCAATLHRYLKIRPVLEIDGRRPLFYTDYGNRWDRGDIYRLVVHYKEKAGVDKPGGAHVFARHTPATIMIANGCDIRVVQEILRHRDIRTTLRYAHVSDRTKREHYERFLSL